MHFTASNLISEGFAAVIKMLLMKACLCGNQISRSNIFLLDFLDWPGGPKRHCDPEEGQSYSLPRHKWAVARQLHALGHQEPRETGRAGQQRQTSTGVERTADGEAAPPLLPHPCPQKQVERLKTRQCIFMSGFIRSFAYYVNWTSH